MDFKVRPKNKFTKMKNIAKSTQEMDRSDIAQAPVPIRKLYDVAMESRPAVLAELEKVRKFRTVDIEQYIEECM